MAESLKALGYQYHSLSDILREELAARGVEEGRDALREIGNELRQAGGPGALARRLVERLSDGRDHIVDSIRNPAEVVELRTVPGFSLVAVDAPARVRYERLRLRDRIGDPETWEAFQAMEAAELASDDPTTQQLVATLEMADYSIENSGGLGELDALLRDLLNRLNEGHEE